MTVITSQPDPLELLQSVALRIPLHHISCHLLCSFSLSPVDGGFACALCFMHNQEGLGWHRR